VFELVRRDQATLDDDVAESTLRRRFHCFPDIGLPWALGIPHLVGPGMEIE
jgi:hypothetical protein